MKLDRFLPRLLRRVWTEQPDTRAEAGCYPFRGALLFADVSGFSTLMEKQTKLGRAGVETFGRVVNRYFDELIQRIERYGGDVISIAGDAILALWVPTDPSEAEEHVALRAVQSALLIQGDLNRYEVDEGIELSVKTVVTCGQTDLVVVGGHEGQWFPFIAGELTEQAGRVLEVARHGEVLLSAQAGRLLERAVESREAEGGFRRLIRLLEEIEPAPVIDPEPLDEAAILPLLPASVRTWHQAGLESYAAERRSVSVMFVDLSALATLGPAPGPEWPGRLSHAVSKVQEVAHRFGGEVTEVVRDDKGCVLVAQWGLPTMAVEHSSERATRAAMEIREALRELDGATSIGVSSGQIICTTVGNRSRCRFMTFGSRVNLAARLMQRADGDILCDATTRESAARLRFEPLGTIEAKGFQEPLPVFRPVGVSETERARSVTLLGRAAERAQLRESIERLRDEGEGDLLLIEGEAGIGKSTLVGELRKMAEAAGARVLEGAAHPIERTTAYYPLARMLEDLLEIDRHTELAAARGRVLEQLGALRDRAALLNDMLPFELEETPATSALDERARADGLRALLGQLVSRAAERSPVVILLEDAHWFDSASWRLLRLIFSALPGVLFAMTARHLSAPEPLEYNFLSSSPRCRRVSLAGLVDETIVELAAAELGVRHLSPNVRRLLVEKSEGNPLFVQQIVLALRDTDALEIEGDRCTLRKSAGEIELPATIQGLVATRVDRLPPEDQLVLKAASVIGRTFELRTLFAIHPVAEVSEAELIGRLEALDLIERLSGDGVFGFRHILTCEVVYGALLSPQRRGFHESCLAWYEQELGEQDLYQPLLAHHAIHAERWEPALRYLDLAGSQALARSANAECHGFYASAIKIAEERGLHVPGSDLRRWHWYLAEASFRLGDLDGCLEKGYACLSMWGTPMPEGALGETRELGWIWLQRSFRPAPADTVISASERDPEADRILELYGRLVDTLGFKLRLPGVVLAASRQLELAEQVGHPGRMAQALLMLYFVVMHTPLKGVGRRFVERALRLERHESESRLRALVLDRGGIALAYRGDVVEAESLALLALDLCAQNEDGRQRTEALWGYAQTLGICGRFAEQEKRIVELIDAAALAADDQFSAMGRVFLAESKMWSGAAEEAIALVDQAANWLNLGTVQASAIQAHGVAACSAVALGRDADAQAFADQAAAELAGSQIPVSWMLGGIAACAQAYLVLASRARGRAARARLEAQAKDVIDKLEWFAAGPYAVSQAYHRFYLGMWQWQKGRRRAAIASWRRSVELCSSWGIRHVEAFGRLALAHALGGEEGRDLRRRGERALEELGLPIPPPPAKPRGFLSRVSSLV